MSIIYRSLNESTGEWATVELPNFDLPRSARFSGPIAERVATLDAAETTVVDQLRAFRERATSAATSGGTAGIEAANANMTALRAIRSERDELNAAVAGIDSIEQTRRAAAHPVGGPALIGGGPAADVDPDGLAPAELVRSARDVIDAEHRDERIGNAAAEALTDALTDAHAAKGVARLALVTGSGAYRSAFAKVLVGGPDAVLDLTDTERHAFARARSEARALSLAGQGEALVPLSLDPAISLVGGGSISAIRGLATTKLISTAEHQVVRSAGVVATWKSEGAEDTDDSPTITPTKIKAHKGTAYVQFSEELAWDQQGLLDDLGVLLRDAADELTAAAFVTGVGAGSVPQGLVTGLAAVPGSVVAGAAFDLDNDPARLLAAVPARHRLPAVFLAHGNFINSLEFVEMPSGQKRYDSIAQGKLLRRDVHEETFMPGTIAANPATTSVLVAADVAKAYTIVNRLGTVLQVVPMLFGANGRPKGESGLRMVFRTGAAVTAPEAGRVLRITPA